MQLGYLEPLDCVARDVQNAVFPLGDEKGEKAFE